MKIIFSILFLPVFCKVTAQPALPDTAFYNQSVTNALAAYQQEMRENLHIYNGAAYLRAGHGFKGTPFFESDNLLPGAVFYDGNSSLMGDGDRGPLGAGGPVFAMAGPCAVKPAGSGASNHGDREP